MHRLLASWFGTGLLPRRLVGTDSGAGTVAAAFTLIPALALGLVGWWAQLGGALVITGVALWATAPFALDGEDPNWVAVDEAAGTMVSIIGLTGWWWVPAFLAFRVLDATKWAPGAAAAQRLEGSVGVTVDDLVAGAWALALGWSLKLLLG